MPYGTSTNGMNLNDASTFGKITLVLSTPKGQTKVTMPYGADTLVRGL